MSTSDMLAIALLACAIFDTIGAKYILPGMLAKNPELTDAQRGKLIGVVNAASLIFFVIAVLIYIFKPLD